MNAIFGTFGKTVLFVGRFALVIAGFGIGIMMMTIFIDPRSTAMAVIHESLVPVSIWSLIGLVFLWIGLELRDRKR